MELELFHKVWRSKNPNENSYAIRPMLLSLPWIEVRSSKEGKTEVVATGQKDGHYKTNSEGEKGGRKANQPIREGRVEKLGGQSGVEP